MRRIAALGAVAGAIHGERHGRHGAHAVQHGSPHAQSCVRRKGYAAAGIEAARRLDQTLRAPTDQLVQLGGESRTARQPCM